jgi:hypothetical protein
LLEDVFDDPAIQAKDWCLACHSGIFQPLIQITL